MSVTLFDLAAALILLAVALLGANSTLLLLSMPLWWQLSHATSTGAYAPVVLQHVGQKAGAPGGRGLAYVLGNMLSAGGACFHRCSPPLSERVRPFSLRMQS